MMIVNRNLILYACVARGTTIVAEFNSRDADLGALAAKCIEKTPLFHSVFSHTTRNKTYAFLIDSPFVYFGIFDQNFEKSQGLSFLNSVKNSFDALSPERPLDSFNPHCFQAEFNPVFHQLVASSSDVNVRRGNLDSQRGEMIRSNSLREDRSMRLKKNKKKSVFGGSKENYLDLSDEGDDADLRREFSVSNHKNGSLVGNAGQQKAKRIWKKQVWVVLLLDLIVCSILFVMWLWICRGFKCVDG